MRALIVACIGLAAAMRPSGRRAAASRRALLGGVAALPLAPHLAAAEEPREAIFSGGNPIFLQPWFDEIKYKGVKSVEVGRLDDDAATRAVRVTYNPAKCTYKLLVGTYLRNVDPTRVDQFPADATETGAAYRPVVWTRDADERAVALEAMRLMEASGVYGKDKPYVVEVLDASPRAFVADPAAQDFYKTSEKAYEKLLKKNGRGAFFEKAYRPITTTACESKTCGYVYFPCSEANGCVSVVAGSW